MVIQPDMDLPQGESFVRQALLGKRYFREKLGVDVRVAYCVDSFGHAATLPQILRQCGFEYYVFMRPEPHEKELPGQIFWWQSPDGSRILTYRIPGPYQTGRLTDYEPPLAQAQAGMPGEASFVVMAQGAARPGSDEETHPPVNSGRAYTPLC